MEMAARVSEKTYGENDEVPALQAVEGTTLSGLEFFGEGDAGMLLQFGGARLEIMAATPVSAANGEAPLRAAEVRGALEAAEGAAVRRVHVEWGRELRLEFVGGLILTVSLRAEDRAGLEAAAYYDQSWRYEAY